MRGRRPTRLFVFLRSVSGGHGQPGQFLEPHFGEHLHGRATVGSQVRSLQGLLDDVRFYLGRGSLKRRGNDPRTIRAAPPGADNHLRELERDQPGADLQHVGGGHMYILMSATNLNPPIVWTPIVNERGHGRDHYEHCATQPEQAPAVPAISGAVTGRPVRVEFGQIWCSLPGITIPLKQLVLVLHESARSARARATNAN